MQTSNLSKTVKVQNDIDNAILFLREFKPMAPLEGDNHSKMVSVAVYLTSALKNIDSIISPKISL